MIKMILHLGIFLALMLLSACRDGVFDEQKLITQELQDTAYTPASCYTHLPWYLDDYARCAYVEEHSGRLYIRSNSMPPHESQFFPPDSLNYPMLDMQEEDYVPISEKLIEMIVPKKPIAREINVDDELDALSEPSDNAYPAGVIGVAINGVALVNEDLSTSDEAIVPEGRDSYSGHVDETGLYHYHSRSSGPLEVLKYNGKIKTAIAGEGEKELYGIMCDGTLVLGCTELSGREPDSSDFDAQNGHAHTIIKKFGKSFLKKRYHTHICPEKYPDWQRLPEIQYYSSCIIEVREFAEVVR